MQVQLKQSEIEAALKGYIAQQGINLTNKTVTCTFTAGRKDSGISVELEIEEQTLMVSPKVSLEIVKADTIKHPVFASAFHNEEVSAPLQASTSELVSVSEEVPKVTTSSLFA